MKEKIKTTNEKYKEVAQVFIKQYNLKKNTRYRFECFRGSLFSKKDVAGSEFYQIAFVEGIKHHPITADLMVLFHFQKRFIVEVVRPNIERNIKTDEDWGRRMRAIVYGLESLALLEIVCSRYLLIDGRHFTYTKEYDRERYKEERLIDDNYRPQWAPPKHWFKEVWFLYYNKVGTLECFQIW